MEDYNNHGTVYFKGKEKLGKHIRQYRGNMCNRFIKKIHDNSFR